MDDIKNCPFCGHSVHVKTIVGITYVYCDNCGLVASFRKYERKHQTIEKWNERVGEYHVRS